ncbi:MAG: RdgB/HAM1 family non-canonical purine NTP pyrophosphatase [Gammaproteobacteria bacterium]
MKIVLASSNKGKAKEIQGYIAKTGLDIELVTQTTLGIASAPETGTTFVENALIKARHASACSGLPALADDSGLVVDCLNGEPGVYSARYSGDSPDFRQHMNKLIQHIQALPSTPKPSLTARFISLIVFLKNPMDSTPLICEGQWEGEITLEPKGSNGFGYDPVFYVPSEGCTAAQLSNERKNQISHRAIALQKLSQLLPIHG